MKLKNVTINPTHYGALMYFFTLGFCDLAWWQMALAILLWPYYLGVKLAGLL